jgi:glycosyltransferase involved in cell wall biosynthesis
METELPDFAALSQNIRVNVCVIGAGIAGMTAAYLLARTGRAVVLIDDGPIAGGETGLLVPPDDPAALADAVLELLADPAHAAAMGEAGLARARNEFSVAKMADRTAALYAAVSSAER